MNMHFSSSRPFRPVQYLGNKTRLLDDIAEAIAEVVPPGKRVADLFSGTSVVGRRLAERNPVTAVDVQAYAATIGRAMLTTPVADVRALDRSRLLSRAEEAARALGNAFGPLIAREEEALSRLAEGDPAPLELLIESGSAVSLYQSGEGHRLPIAIKRMLESKGADAPDATAALTFGGVYFSFRQAVWIDAIASAATAEGEPVREAIVTALLGAASEAVNTVGKQFAQPVRLRNSDGAPKGLLVGRTLRDRAIDIRASFLDHLGKLEAALLVDPRANRVIQSEVDDFLAADDQCEGYYADPPYTIDHYSRFYHVLETLVLRDRPRLATMRWRGVPTIMRGLYREDRHQSDFCVPSRAPGAFHRLAGAARRRGVPLVLSYSGHIDSEQRSRLLSLEQLRALLGEHFSSVDVISPAFEGHRKLNAVRNNLATERGSERLIICRS